MIGYFLNLLSGLHFHCNLFTCGYLFVVLNIYCSSIYEFMFSLFFQNSQPVSHSALPFSVLHVLSL